MSICLSISTSRLTLVQATMFRAINKISQKVLCKCRTKCKGQFTSASQSETGMQTRLKYVANWNEEQSEIMVYSAVRK
jgi:hypothetical protein